MQMALIAHELPNAGKMMECCRPVYTQSQGEAPSSSCLCGLAEELNRLSPRPWQDQTAVDALHGAQ